MAMTIRIPMLAPNPSRNREKVSERESDADDEDEVLVGVGTPVTRKLTAGWYRSATVAVGQAVVVMTLRLTHPDTQPTSLGTVAGRAVAMVPSATRTRLCCAATVQFW